MYVGGLFTAAGGINASGVARWDGASWSPLGEGLNNWVLDFATFDDESGRALYAGGLFGRSGSISVSCIAKWNGAEWLPLALGLNHEAWTIAVFDGGDGPAVYVGGQFTEADRKISRNMAKWYRPLVCEGPGGIAKEEGTEAQRHEGTQTDRW